MSQTGSDKMAGVLSVSSSITSQDSPKEVFKLKSRLSFAVNNFFPCTRSPTYRLRKR